MVEENYLEQASGIKIPEGLKITLEDTDEIYVVVKNGITKKRLNYLLAKYLKWSAEGLRLKQDSEKEG